MVAGSDRRCNAGGSVVTEQEKNSPRTFRYPPELQPQNSLARVFDDPPSENPERARKVWIPTFRGMFYPLAPRIEEVDILDIAYGLAAEPRWAGQSRKPYSVAQHSIRLSRLVRPELAKAALLHDAPEGLGFRDMAKPMKMLFPDLARAEYRCLVVVGLRFGFDVPLDPEIIEMDARCASDEWEFLQLGPKPDDLGPGTGEPVEEPWSVEYARGLFIDRFFEIERQGRGAA
jgi:hypothetical protein